jgi:hypothetical protein
MIPLRKKTRRLLGAAVALLIALVVPVSLLTARVPAVLGRGGMAARPRHPKEEATASEQRLSLTSVARWRENAREPSGESPEQRLARISTAAREVPVSALTVRRMVDSEGTLPTAGEPTGGAAPPSSGTDELAASADLSGARPQPDEAGRRPAGQPWESVETRPDPTPPPRAAAKTLAEPTPWPTPPDPFEPPPVAVDPYH